jgi:hypothetical protein
MEWPLFCCYSFYLFLYANRNDSFDELHSFDDYVFSASDIPGHLGPLAGVVGRPK